MATGLYLFCQSSVKCLKNTYILSSLTICGSFIHFLTPSGAFRSVNQLQLLYCLFVTIGMLILKVALRFPVYSLTSQKHSTHRILNFPITQATSGTAIVYRRRGLSNCLFSVRPTTSSSSLTNAENILFRWSSAPWGGRHWIAVYRHAYTSAKPKLASNFAQLTHNYHLVLVLQKWPFYSNCYSKRGYNCERLHIQKCL